MDVLCPEKYIKKPEFSGKLLINGDLEDNYILFRFLFDTDEMVHPLVISVKIVPKTVLEGGLNDEQEEKIIVFWCNIPDFNNPVMKTGLVFPEFLLKEHRIEVISVESQVSCPF